MPVAEGRGWKNGRFGGVAQIQEIGGGGGGVSFASFPPFLSLLPFFLWDPSGVNQGQEIGCSSARFMNQVVCSNGFSGPSKGDKGRREGEQGMQQALNT